MSIKSNQIQKTSYELDILTIANSLGIDHARLLTYVYSETYQNQKCDDKKVTQSNLNNE